MATIFGIDANTENTFDNAYWKSQPLPVQALQPMDPSTDGGGQRQDLAYKLAGQGYFIDVPIMVWGWGPYVTMLLRQNSGYTSYPDALNGQTRPVDLNPADYPPVVPPTPPVGNLVGAQIGGFGPFYYLTQAVVQAHLTSGYTTEQDGHTYTLQYINQITLSGMSQQIGRWIKIS